MDDDADGLSPSANRRRGRALATVTIALTGIGAVGLLVAGVPGDLQHSANGHPRAAREVAGQASQPSAANTAGCTYCPIPVGVVALTLPTGENDRPATNIEVGDRVDIIATVNTGLITPVDPRQVTRMVYGNVYVIRVGPQSTAPREGLAQGLSGSITVVMSLCDAQYMTWFLRNASLKYVLVTYGTYPPRNPLSTESPLSDACQGTIGPSQVNAVWHFVN